MQPVSDVALTRNYPTLRFTVCSVDFGFSFATPGQQQ